MVHARSRRASAVVAGLLLLLTGLAQPAPAGATEMFGTRFPTEEAFVDQMYRDVLSRGPDRAGLSYWAGRLRSGLPPEELVEFLITSPEFEATTAPIVRLYHSIFDRSPDLGGLRFWVGRSASGTPLAHTAQAMLASAEFEALANASDTGEVVAAVYGRALGRAPDAAGLAYWRDEIDAGRLTLGQFIAHVSESAEHRSLLGGDVNTTLLYLAMLHRLPEPSGLAYWSGRLGAGDRIRTLIAAFLHQPEWQNRFAVQPSLTRRTIGGFTTPWDIDSLPDGTLLVTERPGALSSIASGGAARRVVAADLSDLFASGETGLMGLAIDPGLAANRRFYTCQGYRDPVGQAASDIRVIAWTLSSDATTATRVGPLVTGLPLSSGRHGGCQLEFADDGSLFIGTGDAAIGTNPQNLASLGGKVLRVDPVTGAGWPGNPFAASPNLDTRRIFTYGHRNVQGLSERPGTDQMWSVEHGPARDDEINRLRPGGNAGWNPVPDYNESVPMTNTTLPNAMPAAWSTGSPTLALSGAEWLDHAGWGSLHRGLAVSALKGQGLWIHLFNAEGLSLGRSAPLATGSRFRGLHQTADGSLWVTADNGEVSVLTLS